MGIDARAEDAETQSSRGGLLSVFAEQMDALHGCRRGL
jgi:hypothetical protein